tara:strand:- start:691 stop:2106 length:1416 start_codon:yes stop_codon:yes gene_type:complete
MIALLLASFFFIGVSTFFNFQSQNIEYHNNRLQRKEAATLASIAYYLKERTFELNDSSTYEFFKYKLNELADIHNLDLILYSLEGNLILSSKKRNEQNNFWEKKLNENFISDLNKTQSRLTKRLYFNGLAYLNSYQYVYDKYAKPFAIISIPYFQLNETYKRDLKAYFVALTPIYLLLFFVTSLLAYLLSKQISEPIVKLSSVMQKAALAKQYMPLSWNSADEVGQLVQHYNFMVKELEMSSEKLAQTEKESAWKGMAKQVAHEIKNPLTPMKLNIQMFERKVNQHDADFPVKMKKFTSSLIDQIDTLANIASAFSDFARMPSSKKKALNLSEIVENTISFYDPASSGILKLDKECFVYADQDQIVRVLNNLLSNAIECVKEGETPLVTISLEKRKEDVLLQVVDNGVGIPASLHSKIFEPNFTTKTSGTGLGLAMVKRIIDDLNGAIYFETSAGSGTTFFISIPLLHQKA